MKKQSLTAAVMSALTGRSDVLRCGLEGLPNLFSEGKTEQALLRIYDKVPRFSARSYSVDQLVAALYYLDAADRYRLRPEHAAKVSP